MKTTLTKFCELQLHKALKKQLSLLTNAELKETISSGNILSQPMLQPDKEF